VVAALSAGSAVAAAPSSTAPRTAALVASSVASVTAPPASRLEATSPSTAAPRAASPNLEDVVQSGCVLARVVRHGEHARPSCSAAGEPTLRHQLSVITERAADHGARRA
jgi:hypothetical protein